MERTGADAGRLSIASEFELAGLEALGASGPLGVVDPSNLMESSTILNLKVPLVLLNGGTAITVTVSDIALVLVGLT